MASILRHGNIVVLTSGYLAAAFEIGKEEIVDLIDHKRNQLKYGEASKREVTNNGKKIDEQEIEGNHSQTLDNYDKGPSKHIQPMDSEPVSDSIQANEIQYIISADISQCGQYVAIVSSEKHLIIWNTRNWELMSIRILARKPSRVRFTPISNEILVADKSGSLYLFPLIDDSSNGKLILAHLSMLLDAIVTPDERFVITCDRDEKIRVSYFSAPYNIQSFCQGHLEFVSSISLLPSNPSILVSGSGDGTIRFWNYYRGTEIEALHCHTIHGDGDCERESSAVKSFSLQNINEKTVLCVCLSEFHGSLIYEIETHNIQVDIKFILKLSYAAEPFCLALDDYSIIWSVIPTDAQTVEVQCHGLRTTVNENVKLTLAKINSKKELLSESLRVPSLIPQLYKKKYDNQGSDKEAFCEATGSPAKNGPPAKKTKQSCDEQDSA